MRRKDREVTDFQDIVGIVDRCQSIHIGLSDEEGYPYIVPLNFGYRAEEGRLEFYIHGAMAGRKFELLTKNGKCTFELDNPLALECIESCGDATMRYESVMGKALVELVGDEEKEGIMDTYVMGRQELTRTFNYNRSYLPRTALFRLKVIELSAKRNPLSGGAD